MKPAFSVIFFTTASGAGYGMLFLLGLLNLRGELPTSMMFTLLSFGIAFALVTAGLLSSTLHLGNPQRAWRALSQWRTSWLSREGVMAILTYPIAGIFALLMLFEVNPTATIVFGLLSSLCALLTIYTTANIYSSLKTIDEWHHILVNPNYLLFGLASGCCILFALVMVFSGLSESLLIGSTTLLLVSIVMKRLYWRDIDRRHSASSPETATGLGSIGTVTPLEHPHSQANWVMREMGFKVARDHTRSLRLICLICLMSALACVMLSGVILESAMASIFVVAALPLMSVGIIIERWLFFAEAKHVRMHYY